MTWHRIDYGNGWSRGRETHRTTAHEQAAKASDEMLASIQGGAADKERKMRAQQRACPHDDGTFSILSNVMCRKCGAVKDECFKARWSAPIK